jgi:hypothetical protein
MLSGIAAQNGGLCFEVIRKEASSHGAILT